MRLLFTCFTLSAAVITPGADKLVDDALDGCDALLVKQLRTERDAAYKARDDAVAAKDEQHSAAQSELEELLNSKHEAVRSSLERRLKEDTEALAKRHAEELARDELEDAEELKEAVNAAIKSQNEK